MLNTMSHSRHIGWMVEMGKIPMFTTCLRVGCLRVKIPHIDIITSLHWTSFFGLCEASVLVWFSHTPVLLSANSDASEFPSHNYELDIDVGSYAASALSSWACKHSCVLVQPQRAASMAMDSWSCFFMANKMCLRWEGGLQLSQWSKEEKQPLKK